MCVNIQKLAVPFMAALMFSGAQAADCEQPDKPRWAIALHGGAGSRAREMNRAEFDLVEKSLRAALTAGTEVLSSGGSSLDAVEVVVVALEDDPRFNAGKGAVFNRDGSHELDASIMDGNALRCGAVASVRLQKNPIKAARLVMERSPHVLLAATGADRFALEHGLERVPQSYFFTERRFEELQQRRERAGLPPLERPAYSHEEHADGLPALEDDSGTVGCVALDIRGNLASATSTGGYTAKMPGRIGDSPICGAGTYADNRSCAVSATGKGEEFIRHSIAAKVGWLIEERSYSVDEAIAYCLNDILQPGDGGLIAVDQRGQIAMRASTLAMPRAAADSTGRLEVAIWVDR